jgi:hypothetical protein
VVPAWAFLSHPPSNKMSGPDSSSFWQIEDKEVLDLYKRFVALAEPSIPKVHLWFHALHRMGWFGSPADYSTWEDEAINKWLKACLRLVSQSNFETLGFIKVSEFLAHRGQKRKHGAE